MKKGLLRSMAVLMILGLVVSLTTSCNAQGVASQMGRKFGRGVANIATGWIEIPKNIYDESVETNPAYGFFTGIAKGAGWTVVRTLSGAYDTIFFWLPYPEDYAPLVEPEFVF